MSLFPGLPSATDSYPPGWLLALPCFGASLLLARAFLRFAVAIVLTVFCSDDLF
ncbi:hypothetical protein D3C83_255580 [compost metagenome]